MVQDVQVIEKSPDKDACWNHQIRKGIAEKI